MAKLGEFKTLWSQSRESPLTLSQFSALTPKDVPNRPAQARKGSGYRESRSFAQNPAFGDFEPGFP